MLYTLIIIILAIFIYKLNKLKPTKSLYDRLGGVYSIAAVVNHFSDSVVNNPIAGKNSKNPYLKEWYKNQLDRLPGLKFMRTLWICSATGGPQKYVPTSAGKCPFSLENAHRELKISPEEFDAVAMELNNSLDHFSVPEKEKNEVLSAFSAHKTEVSTGYLVAIGDTIPSPKCPFNL